MPSMPRESGCVSGKAPRPISVVVTGMLALRGQRAELRRGAGGDDAAADVEHGALGRVDRLGGALDLADVALAGAGW